MSSMYAMERLVAEPVVSPTPVMYQLEPVMDIDSAQPTNEEPTRRHEQLYTKQMKILQELEHLVKALQSTNV
eukprot:m.240161 g.240161  ORF g.240161 m.240161 type:complete len:72 (+) comp14567_c0_seq1:37-252(+)